MRVRSESQQREDVIEHPLGMRFRSFGDAIQALKNADNFICAFQLESDARGFQAVLPKRLARFSPRPATRFRLVVRPRYVAVQVKSPDPYP